MQLFIQSPSPLYSSLPCSPHPLQPIQLARFGNPEEPLPTQKNTYDVSSLQVHTVAYVLNPQARYPTYTHHPPSRIPSPPLTIYAHSTPLHSINAAFTGARTVSAVYAYLTGRMEGKRARKIEAKKSTRGTFFSCCS